MDAKTALTNLLAAYINAHDARETYLALKCSGDEALIIEKHFNLMLDEIVTNIADITDEEIDKLEMECAGNIVKSIIKFSGND